MKINALESFEAPRCHLLQNLSLKQHNCEILIFKKLHQLKIGYEVFTENIRLAWPMSWVCEGKWSVNTDFTEL